MSGEPPAALSERELIGIEVKAESRDRQREVALAGVHVDISSLELDLSECSATGEEQETGVCTGDSSSTPAGRVEGVAEAW